MNGKIIAFPADARELNLDELAARIEYQQRRKRTTQNAHGVHVGDLFYDSWGYEQTNIDFYQVVGLKGKATAIIRKIGGDYGPGGYGMTGQVRPVRDHFTSAETFQRRTRIGYSGGPEIGSPRGDGHIWRTSDDATHNYSSYY